MQTKNYKPAQQINWQGRESNPNLGNQYWYQAIEIADIQEITRVEGLPSFALLGYVCDEGVRRNLGRVGACEGPRLLREKLAKIPLHFEDKQIIDAGDVLCLDGDMEACQALFAKHITTLLAQKIFPIGIGGGHDIAYAHFKGIQDFLKTKEKNKVGIINFDAHFDLRPIEEQANSGTPFHQILSEAKTENKSVDYFAIGIQQQSNTRELFEIAKQYGVSYVMNEACEHFDLALKEQLKTFIDVQDYIYITIDLDGFSSAYVSGVSAPSPLGFSPEFVFKVLSFLSESKKVIALDIAELNPSFDTDKLTANLAARIVDFLVMKLD
jgi:formiminoglutamase